VDVTSGFGRKWKWFFQNLELYDGLDVNSMAHIWLLQHLFLGPINDDALQWAESWNEHTLSIRGERDQSPRALFFFGMVQNGPRGLQGNDEEQMDLDHLAEYGVDWNALDDAEIRAHHDETNLEEPTNNPFTTNAPDRLSRIVVEEPNCPLTEEQLHHLHSQLAAIPMSTPQSHRLQWITALNICRQMLS
jgi:hypothetical protein